MKVVVGMGPVRLLTTWRTILTSVVLFVLLLAAVILALMLGATPLNPAEVIAAFLPDPDPIHRMVVIDWRAPRAVAAVVFGACLGMSGAVFQSLTRNPLGSPDVIGLNTGAYTGVVVALMIGATGYVAQVTGALLGGLLAALVVAFLSYRRGVQGFRLIIVGISVSAILSSFNTWFSVKADLGVALQAAIWGAGTLNGVTWVPLGIATSIALLAFLFAPAAARSLRLLELGDDAAIALGVRTERSALLLVVLGTILMALVTAAAGPIPFIALAAPQIARRITGNADSAGLGTAALVGAVLLSAADIAAQHGIPGMTIPTGSVTVCVGGAYLIWLLIRETRRS